MKSFFQEDEIRWDDDILCAGSQSFAVPTTYNTPAVQKLKVWPNPTNEILTIELPQWEEGNGELQVWDTQGQLKKTFDIENDQTIKDINVHNLPNGIYFSRLNINGNIKGVQRFVVTK